MTRPTRPVSWVRPARKDFEAFPEGGRHQGEAYRVGYNVMVDVDVWVLHAFHKKSTRGVKTPQRDIDVIINRLRALKEMSR